MPCGFHSQALRLGMCRLICNLPELSIRTEGQRS